MPAPTNNLQAATSTGIVYDDHMLEHYCTWEESPERPERLTGIIDRCKQLDLISRCKIVPSRVATASEIETLHSASLITQLQSICATASSTLDDDDNIAETEEFCSHYDGHMFVNPNSYNSALLAAGSGIELANAVLNGQLKNGMAIIRPPGHHANHDAYSGFCFFNNVALAAAHALSSGNVKKILIVDFDIHHGNGIQQLFYNDPRVLYFSTHRYDHGQMWPNLPESDFNWIGSGPGAGYNINVPLNKTGMGNSEWLAIWHQLLLPIALQFNPDLVLVAAGYDSALNDPTGKMCLTPQCYPHLIRPLMNLANGKVVVMLEGGYCLKSLAEGAALSLKTLLGDSCPFIEPTTNIMSEAVESILNTSTMLQKYWTLGLPTKLTTQTHTPKLIFNGPPKPDVFPTRWAITFTNECNENYTAQLESLIKNTNLSVAKNKLGIVHDFAWPFAKTIQIETFGTRCYAFNSYTDHDAYMKCFDPYNSSIYKLIGGMIQGSEYQSGIIISPPTLKPYDVINTACSIAVEDFHVQRLLVLNYGASVQGNYRSGVLEPNSDEILSIKSPKNPKILHSLKSVVLNLPGGNSIGDLESGLIDTNLILPIAYELSPQLIIVNHESKTNSGAGKPFSPNFLRLIHLLSACANGRVILMTGHEIEKVSIQGAAQMLTGSSSLPLSQAPLSKVQAAAPKIDASVIDWLGQTLDTLAKHWTMLEPFRINISKNVNIKLGAYEN